jgi:hypothetical protein
VAETFELTTPIVQPARTTYHVARVDLQWDAQVVYVEVRSNDGKRIEKTYTGADAVTLMRGLNTANLTTLSLNKRVLNRLVADGVFVLEGAGTVTGTPD